MPPLTINHKTIYRYRRWLARRILDVIGQRRSQAGNGQRDDRELVSEGVVGPHVLTRNGDVAGVVGYSARASAAAMPSR